MVGSNEELMLRLKSSINRSIGSTYMDRDHSHVYIFSDENIKTSLKSLHVRYTDGVDPISSDCFKHTNDLFHEMYIKLNVITWPYSYQFFESYG